MVITGLIVWSLVGAYILAIFVEESKFYEYPYNRTLETSDFAIVRKVAPFVRRHPYFTWALLYFTFGPVVWVWVIVGCICVGLYMLATADVVR